MDEVLRIQAALLRSQLPDLVLREGMSMVARVAERHERHGIILLAGVPLTAELPDEVRAGDVLRLTVADLASERVTLRITDQPVLPQPAPGVGVPLPGGAAARIAVDPDRPEHPPGAGAATDDVRVTYHSAALGPLELHIAQAGETLSVAVRARAGIAFDRAHAAAEELREMVSGATGRDVQVRVIPRTDPLDVYA